MAARVCAGRPRVIQGGAMITDREMLHRLRAIEPDPTDLAAYADQAEVIDCPPFRALVSAATEWACFAVPVREPGESSQVAAAVNELHARFAPYGRQPRYIFKDALFPTLAPMLESAGLALHEREPLLVCLPERFVPVEQAAVRLTPLHPESSSADLDAYKRIWSDALDGGSWQPTASELTRFRSELVAQEHGLRLLAWFGGQPAGTGQLLIQSGAGVVQEIATRPDLRRRGIAATVTSGLTRSGFEQGASLVYLTAATPEAHALYKKLGYAYAGDEVTYV